MSRFLPSSLVLAAAFASLAGAAIAGTDVMEAALRNAAPVAADSVRTESGTDDVAGAAIDLADAKSYLAELESGNFAGIFAIGNDGAMRCGEVEANPGCAPLTDADKAEAVAEARAAVGDALAAVEDAETDFAATSDVQNAAYAP